MKLPPVEYEAPTTVAEAIDLLAEQLDEASVLAGGQSLIPLLALRLARPAVLIDINGIDELSGVSVTDGRVAIGAMTREYVAEESGAVADAVPLLAAALPLIGHEAIELLAEQLDEASVLAGGQSLIPLLALRLARPEVLIDINGIDELS
ncbi:MAG: FAD binding domain-containing protein, partial [Streptosporangiaceae bacterium]